MDTCDGGGGAGSKFFPRACKPADPWSIVCRPALILHPSACFSALLVPSPSCRNSALPLWLAGFWDIDWALFSSGQEALWLKGHGPSCQWISTLFPQVGWGRGGRELAGQVWGLLLQGPSSQTLSNVIQHAPGSPFQMSVNWRLKNANVFKRVAKFSAAFSQGFANLTTIMGEPLYLKNLECHPPPRTRPKHGSQCLCLNISLHLACPSPMPLLRHHRCQLREGVPAGCMVSHLDCATSLFTASSLRCYLPEPTHTSSRQRDWSRNAHLVTLIVLSPALQPVTWVFTRHPFSLVIFLRDTGRLMVTD